MNSIGKAIATAIVWGAVILGIYITGDARVAVAFILSLFATGAIWESCSCGDKE